jgi:hypothetical protein
MVINYAHNSEIKLTVDRFVVQLAKKTGNCQNKIVTFLQSCHIVKPSCSRNLSLDRLELWSKFNDIFNSSLFNEFVCNLGFFWHEWA